MKKKQIIITSSRGVIDEVRSNFDTEDIEILLIDWDEDEDTMLGMETHYRANIIGNPDWHSLETMGYKEALMPYGEYTFNVTLKSEGHSPEEAWDKMKLDQLTQPLTHNFKEDNADFIELECSVCGLTEDVDMSSDHGFIPEVYVHAQNIGACCQSCQEEFCTYLDREGIWFIDLHTLDLSKLTNTSPLFDMIKDIFEDYSSLT